MTVDSFMCTMAAGAALELSSRSDAFSLPSALLSATTSEGQLSPHPSPRHAVSASLRCRLGAHVIGGDETEESGDSLPLAACSAAAETGDTTTETTEEQSELTQLVPRPLPSCSAPLSRPLSLSLILLLSNPLAYNTLLFLRLLRSLRVVRLLILASVRFRQPNRVHRALSSLSPSTPSLSPLALSLSHSLSLPLSVIAENAALWRRQKDRCARSKVQRGGAVRVRGDALLRSTRPALVLYPPLPTPSAPSCSSHACCIHFRILFFMFRLQRIHDTIEMLDKRERLCEKKIEEQLAKARAFNHAGKRNRTFACVGCAVDVGLCTHTIERAFVSLVRPRRAEALMALKTKKLYEKEQIKISNVRQNLITQQTYLESAASDVEALNALKAGADALKAQHAGLYVRPRSSSGRRAILGPTRADGPRGGHACSSPRNTQKVEDLMEEIDEQMALKNEVAEVISRPFAGTDVDEVRPVTRPRRCPHPRPDPRPPSRPDPRPCLPARPRPHPCPDPRPDPGLYPRPGPGLHPRTRPSSSLSTRPALAHAGRVEQRAGSDDGAGGAGADGGSRAGAHAGLARGPNTRAGRGQARCRRGQAGQSESSGRGRRRRFRGPAPGHVVQVLSHVLFPPSCVHFDLSSRALPKPPLALRTRLVHFFHTIQRLTTIRRLGPYWHNQHATGLETANDRTAHDTARENTTMGDSRLSPPCAKKTALMDDARPSLPTLPFS